jgi:hypothetical protein
MKVSVNLMDIKKNGTLSHLEFLKEHVFGITDITRKNKLSEILNQFSGKETSEIYVIQNAKNKDAAGVLADVEYFKNLLETQRIFEGLVDAYMEQVTMERQNDVADIEFTKALEGEEFSFDEILALAAEVEIDED